MAVADHDVLDVSVVVPCRDAGPHLAVLLDSLVADRPAVSWEVVVVDNGSRDDSAALAGSYAERLPLRVVEAPGAAGPGQTRNAGAAVSRGGCLVFLDADDAIAPGYLDAMHRALAGADLVASRPDAARLNPGWVARSRPLGVEDGLNHSLGFLPFATSACLGVRRSAFDGLGGFGPLRTCEDIDFCWRAQRRGFTLAAAPGAVLHYRLRARLPAILRQAVGYGRSMPALYRRFGPDGMPRAGWREVASAWRTALARLVSGDRARRAEGVYLLGLAAGRVVGSVRHRVRYL
jgi:glycosyltransferase involved in cell wall biosynthesis